MDNEHSRRGAHTLWRERVEALPTQLISIATTLGDIPDTTPCPCCVGKMERALVPIESYSFEGNVRVIAEIPGYVCPPIDDNCGVHTYDLRSSVQFLTAAHEIILGTGDIETANRLQASINAGSQSLAIVNAQSATGTVQ